MKTKKKISFKPYLIILVITIIIVWGQGRDEQLLPVVKEQLSYIIPKTNIPNEQNAFIAMAGFNMATSGDMLTEGFKAIQKTVEQTKKTPFEYNLKFEAAKGNEITQLYQLPCDTNFANSGCIEEIINNANHIRQLMEQQTSFINNYLALQSFTEFANILPANIDSSVPYQYIVSISQLLTANAILEIKAGDIDQGMNFLLKDIKFYRNLLSSEKRSLEDTMIASNQLLQHYFVIDRLLHSGVDLKPYLAELNPLLQSLNEQERNLAPALERERDYHLVIQATLGHFYFYTGDSEIGGCYNNSCAVSRYFSRLLYKFNGTLNAVYLDWQPTIDFAKADYPLDDNFLQRLKTLQTIENNHHTFTVSRLYERYGLFFLKNYIGEKHKNTIYYANGYTSNFINIYVLNSAITQLNSTIQRVY